MMRKLNKINLLALVTVAAVSFSAPCLSAPQPEKGSVTARDMLEEKIAGKTFQVCKFVVNAKADDIWKILTDYKNAQYVFPCLKKCRIVQDKGSTKLVEHHIRPSGIPTNFEYLLEIKETEPG